MDEMQYLGEVQRANLMLLMVMKNVATRDLGGAIISFGIGREQFEAIVNASPDQLLNLVSTIGSQSLFLPRKDISALMNLPAAVSPIIAAARDARPPQVVRQLAA